MSMPLSATEMGISLDPKRSSVYRAEPRCSRYVNEHRAKRRLHNGGKFGKLLEEEAA